MARDIFSNSDPFKKKDVLNIGAVTVMIRYTDGKVSAHHNITNPWIYMSSLKKHANIKSTWIDKK